MGLFGEAGGTSGFKGVVRTTRSNHNSSGRSVLRRRHQNGQRMGRSKREKQRLQHNQQRYTTDDSSTTTTGRCGAPEREGCRRPSPKPSTAGSSPCKLPIQRHVIKNVTAIVGERVIIPCAESARKRKWPLRSTNYLGKGICKTPSTWRVFTGLAMFGVRSSQSVWFLVPSPQLSTAK